MLSSIAASAVNVQTTRNDSQPEANTRELLQFNDGVDQWAKEDLANRGYAAKIIKDACINKRTELSIYAPGLESLPLEIGQLTSLKTLDLSNTRVRALPESVSQLVNLEIFAPGLGFLTISESVAQLPKLRIVPLFYAHALLFKPEFPRTVDVQGGGEIAAVTNIVAQGNTGLIDFPAGENGTQKLQGLMDYAESKMKSDGAWATHNNHFIKQLCEKAQSLPEINHQETVLKAQAQRLTVMAENITVSEKTMERVSEKINVSSAALSQLSVQEKARATTGQQQGNIESLIAALNAQNEEAPIIKLLEEKVDLQTMLHHATTEQFSALVNMIVESRLNESSKQKYLSTYLNSVSKPSANDEQKQLAFRQLVLSSDLDEITKFRLVPNSGITFHCVAGPSHFKINDDIYPLDQAKEILQSIIKGYPLMPGDDVFPVQILIEAGHRIFPERHIYYCNSEQEVRALVGNFKKSNATNAHIVTSSGGHRYLLDLHRHPDNRITALAIDPVGVNPHFEAYMSFERYKNLFDKSDFMSTRVLSSNSGCTIFSAHFALCAYRYQDQFTRMHEQFLNGVQPNRKDLPLVMFKHIQSSKEIEKLELEGLEGMGAIAVRRDHFGKTDSNSSIAYQRRDYIVLALHYLNSLSSASLRS